VINKTITWPDFRTQYQAQLEAKNQPEIFTALATLIRAAATQGRDVTLLCFEPDEHHCHRQLIIEHLLQLDPQLATLISSTPTHKQ
jgi:uncharacterized protein YeaO (DUF488 family)